MKLNNYKSKRQPISISDVQYRALTILREKAKFHVDEVIIDDDWHRCKLESRVHLPDKDGAYAVHYNNGDFPLMAWHDWTIHSKPIIEKLFDESTRLISDIDKGDFKKSVEEFKKKLEEKQNEIWEINATKAQEFVAKLQPVPADNTYLANKHVAPVEGLLGDKGNLYYPIQDINGKIWSYQQIYYNRYGKKISYLMKGGKKKGNFFIIKGDGDHIFFAEGIATAISVYLATGETTVCCIDASNLEHVVKSFYLSTKVSSSKRLVVVADNDFTGTRNGKPYNKGLTVARKIEKYCDIIVPMQGENYTDCVEPDGSVTKNPLTDANDYHNEYGLQALTEFINNALNLNNLERMQVLKNELANSESNANNVEQKPEEEKNDAPVWRPASGIKKLPTSTGEDVEADKDWIEETRPVVQYDPDMVVQCRNDLAKYLHPYVYMFGNNLVRVVRLREKKVLRKDRQGNETALLPLGNTSIEILDSKAVCIEAAKILRWEKWDDKKKDYKSCTPPTDVCDSLHHDRYYMNFRILNKISNCPVIFPDGTILFNEGYYEDYGLLLDFCGVQHHNYNGYVFSKENAKYNLDILLNALSEFPFKSEVDRAVAVSAILTAVARASIKKAPMFAFNANASGVGKSTLTDAVGIIATGKCPSCVTWKDDRVEMNKEIFATVLEGAQVVVIDNANDVKVNDPTLAQAVERESIKGRILGMSKNGEAPCNALWMINGKRLTIVEDMRRRTLLCTLDTNEEHPERHHYKNKNFYDWILENRRNLVSAAIVVLRAYIDAGKPDIENLSPYTDYQEWSDFVRAPIVWLGLEDPLKAQEAMAKIDPVRMEFGAILKAWYDKYSDKPITVKDIFSNKPSEGAVLDCNPNILSEIFNDMYGDKISNGRVGKYLSSHNGMIIDGLRFVQLEEKTRDNKTQFCVVKNQ